MIKYNTPWDHYVWKDFLSYDEQYFVYKQCLYQLDEEAYQNNSLFEMNGELQNNVGVLTCLNDKNIDQKINSQLYVISEQLGYKDKGEWSYSACITKDFEDEDRPLLPHNDDYDVLKKYGAGMLKVLVYLGNDKDNYEDWGTKLYQTNQRSSFSKEITYQPGDAFIFIPNKYTYHGTDFKNKLNNYRFTLGAEYIG